MTASSTASFGVGTTPVPGVYDSVPGTTVLRIRVLATSGVSSGYKNSIMEVTRMM